MSDTLAILEQRRKEMTALQIVELYRDGYVSLKEAKSLAKKHAGDMARHIKWLRMK